MDRRRGGPSPTWMLEGMRVMRSSPERECGGMNHLHMMSRRSGLPCPEQAYKAHNKPICCDNIAEFQHKTFFYPH